jgi:hypothetical protein
MVEGQEGEGAAQRGGLLEGAVFGEGEVHGHVIVGGRSKGGGPSTCRKRLWLGMGGGVGPHGIWGDTGVGGDIAAI